MKRIQDMTEEEANSFVSSLSAMFKNNVTKADVGYEPYLSEDDAKLVRRWIEGGKKGPCPPVILKSKKI